MIGLNAEFEYPSQDNILKVRSLMQVLQNAAAILTQKKGNQLSRNTPCDGKQG